MNAPTAVSIPPVTSNGQASAPSSPRTAWIDFAPELSAELRERLGCTGVLMGIFSSQRPQADELLLCDRIDAETVQAWLNSGFRNDGLFRNALRVGAASGEDSPWSTDEAGPTACATIAEGYPDRRHWVVFVTRCDSEFSTAELRSLSLSFRAWIARFNRPLESKMSRLLTGHDDRLIHADPAGAARLDAAGVEVSHVVSELRAVAQQRWPDLADGRPHDVVFSLADQPVWIRFERRRALTIDAAEQWHLEMRPLDSNDLPPIGLLDDDRIARALGYIHDRYAQSPSLNTISRLVDISAFHFHRTFARLVGTTPKQYVLQKQVQMAKWMLAAQRVPISVIADATGFASHGHFTSTFRRLQNMSPSEYREQVDA